MVAYVEAVKEELRDSLPESGNESVSKKSGGQSRPDSQAKVAKKTGIPRQTISAAQSHVETVDAFPFMQPWPQISVFKGVAILEELPGGVKAG